MSSILKALEELGLAVFEHIENGNFLLTSSCPTWMIDLYPDLFQRDSAAGDCVTLINASSRVESFLIHSHQYWLQKEKGAKPPQRETWVWSEFSQNGQEYEIEGQALLIDSSRFIALRHKPLSIDIIQNEEEGDGALFKENIRSNLAYRQRKLFSQVESYLGKGKELRAQEITSISQFPSVITDADGQLIFANPAYRKFYATEMQQEGEITQIYERWLKQAERYYPEIQRKIARGKYWEGEIQETLLNGKVYWVRLCIGSVLNEEGEIHRRVCILSDISALTHNSSFEVEEGYFDLVTHLPSRRYLWTYFQNLQDGDAKPCHKLALFYIDIDHFKRVNLRHGHAAGDHVLNTMATRLLRNIKRSDLVVSLGGDAFAVLLNCAEDNSDLDNIGQRLQSVIAEGVTIDGTIVTVSASIGAYITDLKSLDSREIIHRAYLALYSAKELGRRQLRYYESSMEDHLPVRQQRELELEQSLQQDRFKLYFQPKEYLNDPKVLSYEVLLRWDHPQLGLLEPKDFISLAEETDLIVPLGDWIIQRSCAVGAQQIKKGLDPRLAVNITAKQLQQPHFVPKLQDHLQSSGFPPQNLELEITESNLLQNLAEVKEKLIQIRLLGISVALDDFGSGYSSLNYLRILPIDVIKIDRSFIKDLPHDQESAAIATWVINLAHKLNLTVVAEGAETPEQVEFLKSRKVDFLQGYFISPPVPEDQL